MKNKMINDLLEVFITDLDKVMNELNLYKNDSDMWDILKGTANSGGNLMLHLIGNLNTYIGRNLGGIEYKRDRSAEFSSKNIPKNEVLKLLENTMERLKITFIKLNMDDLSAIYPEEVMGFEMTTQYFLFHLLAHLNYHLGQINYHRRAMDKS